MSAIQIQRLRREIGWAQQSYAAINSHLEHGEPAGLLESALAQFLEHASMARLLSLYLGEASLDRRALRLRQIFRSADFDRVIEGPMQPRFGLNIYRVADERFDLNELMSALDDLLTLLDEELPGRNQEQPGEELNGEPV